MRVSLQTLIFILTWLVPSYPLFSKNPDVQFDGSLLVETDRSVNASPVVRSSGNWKVTPLPSENNTAPTAGESPAAKQGSWFVFRPSLGRTEAFGLTRPGQNPEILTTSRSAMWEYVHNQIKTLTAAQSTLRSELKLRGEAALTVEPNMEMAFREDTPVGKINPAWPHKEFAWHLEDSGYDKERKGYSQLRTARAMVEKKGTGSNVMIAHLDTGYDPRHSTLPRNFQCDKSFTLDRDGQLVPGSGVATQGVGHGTGSLGLLAGNHVKLGQLGFDDDLGGAPDAKVFSVNILAGSQVLNVVHLCTATMGSGIWRAVDNGADVITISAGGAPSEYWARAVNHAYENGVPIFAAAGDFFTLPIIGIPVTPYRTVYPAAFSRAMSVTGATSAYGAYGKHGTWLGFLPWYWGDAMMRGNYGPLSQKDKSIAGYAPNVPWAVLENGPGPHLLISLGGAGTSSTTPQASAAAALWLAYHEGEVTSRNADRTQRWRRAEQVYQALIWTVAKSDKGERFNDRYFGSGMLRAAEALRHAPDAKLREQERAKAGWEWLKTFLPQGGATPLQTARSSSISVEQRALYLEAHQLIANSNKLQDILEKEGATTRLWRAIAREKDCSPTLRTAINRGLNPKSS